MVCGTIEQWRYNDLELDVIILMCQIAFSRAGVNQKKKKRKKKEARARERERKTSSSESPRWLDVKRIFASPPFFTFSSFVIYNQCNYIHTRYLI